MNRPLFSSFPPTITLALWLTLAMLPVRAQHMTSPDGRLTVETAGTQWIVCYDQKSVLLLEEMPIVGQNVSASYPQARAVTDDYTMLTGKRKVCHNEGREYAVSMGNQSRLVMRLYNDGISFRYEYKNLQQDTIPEEHTVYRIAEGTKRWMQQWTDSYEGFFPFSTTCKVKPEPSYSGVFASSEGYNNRWGYPALLEPADGIFVLLSEANVERCQSGSCLYNDGERFRVVPAENGSRVSGTWHTPWRVAIIGTLDKVVESTLITDVSEPSRLKDTSWIKPGAVSWIYWAYNHGSNEYPIICQYVDLAQKLHLPYVLIDAEWDEMHDGKTIDDAIGYAKSKGVKPLVWYNSSVGWVDGAPGPKFRLNDPDDREREFSWCEQMGVAGVKIDFFSGDNLRNMEYCQDLLESAARHHLLVNFHGATIPRGWQRTYPNLMTTEGVYGAEWYNNVPTFTAKAARHNATLPFTRNVIGPMDYTPCTFSDSQHPHITTNAHELALTVLFESGLQHLADRPESYLAQPETVRDFMSMLPTVWDETRLLGGYPGESVVLARRHGTTWYVAGINGTDEKKTLLVPVDTIAADAAKVTLFADGNPWSISTENRVPAAVDCQPRGGFVLVIAR